MDIVHRYESKTKVPVKENCSFIEFKQDLFMTCNDHKCTWEIFSKYKNVLITKMKNVIKINFKIFMRTRENIYSN